MTSEYSGEKRKQAESLGRSLAARKDAASEQPSPGGQLPLFPEADISAIPNHLARTSLFAPIRAGDRAIHDNALLDSPAGVEIRFSGKQLDMSDQDVFMLALKLAQGVDLNQPVCCDRADFLRELGWRPGKNGSFGKSAYEWLDQSFQLLTSGTLHIKTKRYKAHLPLVADWVQDEETGRWEFTVGGKVRTLFQNHEYAFVDLAKRKRIAHRIDLAKWLQSYAATHEAGLHRISVANLKKWCKYKSPMRKFMDALQEALAELERLEILIEVEFYDDGAMVRWVRPSTTA